MRFYANHVLTFQAFILKNVANTYTLSSQPSSSCSPAAPHSVSAQCTRVWCPLWPPASSEGSWTTGHSERGAPSACAAPWLKPTWEEMSMEEVSMHEHEHDTWDDELPSWAFFFYSFPYLGPWEPKMASKSSLISILVGTRGNSATRL